MHRVLLVVSLITIFGALWRGVTGEASRYSGYVLTSSNFLYAGPSTLITRQPNTWQKLKRPSCVLSACIRTSAEPLPVLM